MRSTRTLYLISVLGILGACELPPEPTPVATTASPREGPCHYIDSTGAEVIGTDLAIHDGFDFREGLAGVENNRGKVGYVDRSGKLVIPFQFDDATSFSEDLVGVLQRGMCGYVDRDGDLAIPLIYDSVSSHQDGWGLVQQRPRYSFVDTAGREIGESFSRAESFSEGLAAVSWLPNEAGGERSLWGFIDTEGKTAIEPRFEKAEPFSEGFAAVRIEGRWGYIDTSGELVVEPRFDLAGPFSEGLAQVNVGAKMGYIDSSGATIIEPRFQADQYQSDPDEKPVFIGRFVDGIAAVRFSITPEAIAGWGFIDRKGHFLFAPDFEDAFNFSEGLAAVRIEGRWGYIDTTGELVIGATYSRANEFKEGLALVCD